MHKLLVKMKGNYGFVDMSVVPPQSDKGGRPFVVLATRLVQRQISLGYMTQLADLPDDATDADWAGFYEDHDQNVQAALENYKLSFEGGEVAEPKPAAKPAKKKAPKAEKAEAAEPEPKE